MKKKLTGIIRLNIMASKATSAPPVGSILGIFKLNISDFCKDFNNRTKHFNDELLLNVKVFVYSDRTYDMVIKTPKCSFLLKYFYYSGLHDSFYSNYSVTPEILYEVTKLKSVDYPNLAIRSLFNTVVASALSSTFKIYLN